MGYGFAEFNDSLQQLVARRLLERKQAEDERAARMAEARAREALELQKAQEARIKEYQDKTFEDVKYNREDAQIARRVDDDLPGDLIDDVEKERRIKHGFGGTLRTLPAKPADEGFGVYEDLTQTERGEGYGVLRTLPADVTRTIQGPQGERTVARGGSKYLQAKEARESREAQAMEMLEFREAEAQKDRELKELIVRMQTSANAETRELANELTRLRITGERDKQETARIERERTKASARQQTQTALDSVSKLLDPKGLGAHVGVATGAYELRGFTQGAQDFNAERDMLIAALALPNLGALKGPMSDKDVIFVKQLATKLANRRMSEAETRRELLRAKKFLEDKMNDQGGQDDYADPNWGMPK